LARKARERMPNLAVLFTSGYTDDAILDSGRPNESVELLTKPYSRETLARKLRHMLANVAQLKAVHDPTRHGEPAAPKKTLRILVCEDDVDIRDTTVDILSSIGHQAMSASDARTALSILKSNPIDILLTDVGLPDMSGATLAEYATSRFPALAVIFATGRSPGPTVSGSVTTRTLVKPFSYDDLVAVITSLTQGGENTSR